MNRVLDLRRARRGPRAPALRAPVSVLRWPATSSASGVFEMFGAQEAGRFDSLEVSSEAPWPSENLLLVSASRTVAPDPPLVHLSLVNTSPFQAVKLSLRLAGRKPKFMSGHVLTAPALTASGAVAAGHSASPAAFHGAVLSGRIVAITVPARSVVVLTIT